MHSLLPYVDANRIRYGSEYPYTPEAGALELIAVMNEHLPSDFPSAEDQERIHRGNAEQILHQ